MLSVARLGIGCIRTWSVSRIITYGDVTFSSIPGTSKSCLNEFGRLSTPKWKWEASTSAGSSVVKIVSISASSPSGLPPGVAHSRVNPAMSVHGPPAAFCFFQWKYLRAEERRVGELRVELRAELRVRIARPICARRT